MGLSEEKVKLYTRRLMMARMGLLIKNGFYGLLLMHVKIGLSSSHETAWVEKGEKMCFNPDFLEKLSDTELEYVLMHLTFHLALKHLARREGTRVEVFDQAADIVANSNIYKGFNCDAEFISLREFGGVQPHCLDDGREGADFTVEEIYQELLIEIEQTKQAPGDDGDSDDGEGDGDQDSNSSEGGWDHHETDKEEDPVDRCMWVSKIEAIAEAMQQNQHWGDKSRGTVPKFFERYIQEYKNPQVDWRTVLEEFIQEEVTDYSFTPPDRRFQDNPFFLPDYNEKEFSVKKILFMIDTSGSMSNGDITYAYSEIKGAIDQFGGALEGWLGFFDADVVEPIEFQDEDEFEIIRPRGGGGTSFHVIFEYVREKMEDDLPVSIVILTDGYAPYPDYADTLDIPVLWIITNEDRTPPWGRIARIKTSGK